MNGGKHGAKKISKCDGHAPQTKHQSHEPQRIRWQTSWGPENSLLVFKLATSPQTMHAPPIHSLQKPPPASQPKNQVGKAAGSRQQAAGSMQHGGRGYPGSEAPTTLCKETNNFTSLTLCPIFLGPLFVGSSCWSLGNWVLDETTSKVINHTNSPIHLQLCAGQLVPLSATTFG